MFTKRIPKPTPAPSPRPLIIRRDPGRDLSEAEVRRLFRDAIAADAPLLRAVRQTIYDLMAEAGYDITDASLSTENLRHAAGGFGNLAELLVRIEAAPPSPVDPEQE